MRLVALLGALLLALAATAGELATTTPAALAARLQSAQAGLLVLDVRSPAEYAAGHVPGAVNIPHDQLGERLAELDAARDGEVVVYCRSGRRAGIALGLLSAAGFGRLGHLEGDFLGWQAEGLPVAEPAARDD